MSHPADPEAALDATMSAPGTTPRATAPAHAAVTPAGDTVDAGSEAPARTGGPAGADTPLGPGDTLGRYVLGEQLGAGGMGFVFRARDPDLGREVAIKILRTGGDGSSGALERRLLREAQAMATLSHDHLAMVYDIGHGAGRVFVAMELLDGGTLRALLADRQKPWRDKLAAVVAAGRGLAAAHSAGVIHRDFKPDNVLVARNGRVKVVDFGLARADAAAADDAEPRAGDSAGRAPLPADLSANLTQTGALLGTPAYMAPEQHAGEAVDARADQFAFAVTAWEAVYGRRPFATDAYSSLVAAVRAHEVTPPPRGTGVPAALDAVLRRALLPAPRDRYTSMDALLAAIEDAIRPRRARWWLAGGALVAAAGALIAYVVTRDGGGAVDAGAGTEPVPRTVVRREPGVPARVSTRAMVRVAPLDLSDLVAAVDDEDTARRIVAVRMGAAAVARAHHASTLACYERAGAREPGLVLVEYQLAATGEVEANRVLEDEVGGGVADCLLAASRTWHFPATVDGKPTTVRLPFAFQPAGALVGGDDGDPAAVRLDLPPLPGLPDGLDLELPAFTRPGEPGEPAEPAEPAEPPGAPPEAVPPAPLPPPTPGPPPAPPATP